MNIRKRRERKKFTQRELAKMMGVTERTVQRWEKEQHRPCLKQILRLNEVLREV